MLTVSPAARAGMEIEVEVNKAIMIAETVVRQSILEIVLLLIVMVLVL
jgi:hypothetical protein